MFRTEHMEIRGSVPAPEVVARVADASARVMEASAQRAKYQPVLILGCVVIIAITGRDIAKAYLARH